MLDLVSLREDEVRDCGGEVIQSLVGRMDCGSFPRLEMAVQDGEREEAGSDSVNFFAGAPVRGFDLTDEFWRCRGLQGQAPIAVLADLFRRGVANSPLLSTGKMRMRKGKLRRKAFRENVTAVEVDRQGTLITWRVVNRLGTTPGASRRCRGL